MRSLEDIGSKGHFSAKKGVTNSFLGQNNIKIEFSTIKLLRVQIFSKIRQLLKNHYLRGFLNIFWGVKGVGGGPGSKMQVDLR